MTIESFLQNYFRKRLAASESLLVYDPQGLYRGIVNALAEKDVTIVDGTGSTIRGREEAMKAWRALSTDSKGNARLMVYLPLRAPRDESEKQQDPYSIFGLEPERVFPNGAGEEFQALCRQACPDQISKIDQLFASGSPDLAVVNQVVSGGSDWPTLKTLLHAESATEILCALLSPTPKQKTAFTEQEGWVSEMKGFLQASMGLALKTKSQKQPMIAEEVWRYVLFSEFALDLPGELPEALSEVPRASKEAETLIYAVCDRLRGADSYHEAYMNAAERVAKDLNLFERAGHLTDLGERDTFAFEEGIYLGRFAESVLSEDLDRAATISFQRKRSIWVKNRGERRQLWTLADQALEIIRLADDIRPELAKAELKVAFWFDLYCSRMRNLDTLHRSFERSAAELFGEYDCLQELVPAARKAYRAVMDKLQGRFIDAVEKEGWPISGSLRQTEVFTREVEPLMKAGKRVAFFMVDALRYELAAELEKDISQQHRTDLQPVCGQLPSVTRVGMASLLPGAREGLRIRIEKGKPVPQINGKDVLTPADRLAVLKERFGDKCAMIDLDTLVQKPDVAETIDLLVVKTTDIDSIGETKPLEALNAIPGQLRKLRAGVSKAQKLGFDTAVIVSDHGFILWYNKQAGDKVAKPAGDWEMEKERCLLGSGSEGPGSKVMGAESLGIPIDCSLAAIPRSIGTFIAGCEYTHGGLSLQESVVPFLKVELRKREENTAVEQPELHLTYKGAKSGTITTRRPMVEVTYLKTGLFSEPIEFALEALAGNDPVGEPVQVEWVNPATGLVRLEPGSAVKIPIRMEDDFEGSFTVRASDPDTGVILTSLKMKTDYVG